MAGAILLLKEAFPQLTGAQLLMALYTTAIDMGVAGEDNVYGNGLIDVHAAFLWLAQQHTPRDPLQPHYDLSVRNLQSQDGRLYGCDSLVQLDLILENKGNLPLNQVQVEVSVNGTSQSTATYGVQLPAQGAVDTLRFSAIAWSDSGANEIRALVSIDSVDYDPVNNAGMFRYHRNHGAMAYLSRISLMDCFGAVGTLITQIGSDLGHNHRWPGSAKSGVGQFECIRSSI